jgi:uncharacterized OB-fold protein
VTTTSHDPVKAKSNQVEDSQLMVPVVDYLVLAEPPYLRCKECSNCGAVFLDRRNACAACGGLNFIDKRVSRSGRVAAFTIVHTAKPGVRVPFVAVMVDCDGVLVRANLVNIKPTPDSVHTGMKVGLMTYEIGMDARGRRAVGFGFALEGAPGAGETYV